ncbi:hypothetical protein MY11210_008636, partial [Beauveria gryllotalpidicola]
MGTWRLKWLCYALCGGGALASVSVELLLGTPE